MAKGEIVRAVHAGGRHQGLAEIGIELSPGLWLLCWPLAKLVSLMPISLGGFGLREAALAGILYATARVPSEQGVALSLLWQCVIVSGGLLGGLGWLSMRARGRESRDG